MRQPLAVRETAPFAPSTLRRFRRLLYEERRAQLERRATLVDVVGDGVVTVEWELWPVVDAQTRHTLDEIDEALLRLEAGTYGWCEACGARLPADRLEALPSARCCVTCQRTLDVAG
jgi:DnaK suppressor protein